MKVVTGEAMRKNIPWYNASATPLVAWLHLQRKNSHEWVEYPFRKSRQLIVVDPPARCHRIQTAVEPLWVLDRTAPPCFQYMYRSSSSAAVLTILTLRECAIILHTAMGDPMRPVSSQGSYSFFTSNYAQAPNLRMPTLVRLWWWTNRLTSYGAAYNSGALLVLLTAPAHKRHTHSWSSCAV